jgi:hypothetical protein
MNHKNYRNSTKAIIQIVIILVLLISSLEALCLSNKNLESISKKDREFQEFDMVIISPDSFSKAIQPLIDHKNDKGVKTFLETTEEIYSDYQGRDNPEQIKYFIKNAIETLDIKYVLLVGGRKGQTFEWYVPPRYVYVDDGFMHKYYLSDLYFADIFDNNNDFVSWDSNNNGKFAEWYTDKNTPSDIIDIRPDLAIGRLPCRDELEVEAVVKKIIDYENNAYGKSWSNNVLLIGGDTNPGLGDPFAYEGEADCKYTVQFLDKFNITELYVSDGTLTNYEDFISSFNKGNGFILYHGHGLQDGLFTHTPEGNKLKVFDTEYIPQLNNEGMYPIVVVGCCLTTEFDVGIWNFLTIFQNLKQHRNFFNFKYECVSESISWKMIKKSNGGSIAHIGDSSTAWGADGDTNNDSIPDSVQMGYTSGLCTEFFKIIGSGEIKILGDVHSQTLKTIIENNSPFEDRVQCKCIIEFQLIGDPSLKIGGYE